MIPSLRSISELIAIASARESTKKGPKEADRRMIKIVNEISEVSSATIDKKKAELPNLQRTARRKWKNRKEAVSKFFDELDYNNQIQSSYDLTLLGRQNNSDKKGVA